MSSAHTWKFYGLLALIIFTSKVERLYFRWRLGLPPTDILVWKFLGLLWASLRKGAEVPIELQMLLLVCAFWLQPQSHSYVTATSRRSSKPTGLMVKLCLGLLEEQLLVSTLTSKETYTAEQSGEWMRMETHFLLVVQIRVIGVLKHVNCTRAGFWVYFYRRMCNRTSVQLTERWSKPKSRRAAQTQDVLLAVTKWNHRSPT